MSLFWIEFLTEDKIIANRRLSRSIFVVFSIFRAFQTKITFFNWNTPRKTATVAGLCYGDFSSGCLMLSSNCIICILA